MNNGLLGTPVGSQQSLMPRLSQYTRITDRRASGNAGDLGAGIGTVPLNTIDIDEIGVRLAANQIMLPAGRYRVRGRSFNMNSNCCGIRFYNVTEAAVCAYGHTDYSSEWGGGAYFTGAIFCHGQFDARGGERKYELQRLTETNPGTGWSIGITQGNISLYGTVELWRLA